MITTTFPSKSSSETVFDRSISSGTDSGPGVPEDLREKIFEPFYRAELNVPGTGLGMSIARTLNNF